MTSESTTTVLSSDEEMGMTASTLPLKPKTDAEKDAETSIDDGETSSADGEIEKPKGSKSY